MILELDEAMDTLRLDGEANEQIVDSLVRAIPSYLEVTTGRSWDDDKDNELAKTTAKFILQLWYDQDGQDTEQLKRTIDTLLGALTALGRNENG